MRRCASLTARVPSDRHLRRDRKGAVAVDEADLTRFHYFLNQEISIQDDTITFDCPVCRAQNTVPMGNVPAEARHRIKAVSGPRIVERPCVVIEGWIDRGAISPPEEEIREGWASAFSYWAGGGEHTLFQLEIGVDGCHRCLDKPWEKESLSEASTLAEGEACSYCERTEKRA